MNKSQLSNRIAEKFIKLSKKKVESCTNHILDLLSEALEKNERIEIRGFGSFSLRHRTARVSYNPRTGTQLFTTDTQTVHFKPGKELRTRVVNKDKGVKN